MTIWWLLTRDWIWFEDESNLFKSLLDLEDALMASLPGKWAVAGVCSIILGFPADGHLWKATSIHVPCPIFLLACFASLLRSRIVRTKRTRGERILPGLNTYIPTIPHTTIYTLSHTRSLLYPLLLFLQILRFLLVFLASIQHTRGLKDPSTQKPRQTNLPAFRISKGDHSYSHYLDTLNDLGQPRPQFTRSGGA